MTTNTKKKKSAREKRVLTASLIVAAVMVGGSTFAWFTSKDEVTNRLTAKGNYSVTAAEDYDPPKDIVPGQTVKKEVSVLNTGNIDALVRVGLESVVSGHILTTTDSNTLTNAVTVGHFDLTTDYTQTNNDASFLKELESIMAGGRLVYAPAISGSETIKFTNRTDSTKVSEIDPTKLSIANPALIESGSTLADGSKEGYYIFVREDGTTKTYNGFYYKDGTYYRLQTAIGTEADTTNGNAKNGRTGNIDANTLTITSEKITAVTTPIVATRTIDFTGDSPKDKIYTVLHSSTGTTTNDEILVVIDVGNDDSTNLTALLTGAKQNTLTGGTANDLIYHLALSNDAKLTRNGNTGTVWTSDYWTAVTDTTVITGDIPADTLKWVYYNYSLESGEESKNLIDSVTLDERCSGGYVDFTYDINVIVESVQVTYDKAGNEIAPGGAEVGAEKTSVSNKPNNWNAKVTVRDTASTNGEIDNNNDSATPKYPLTWAAVDAE